MARILLGVTGGIAAYKALGLARLDPAGRSPVRLDRLAESVGGPRCGSAG